MAKRVRSFESRVLVIRKFLKKAMVVKLRNCKITKHFLF